MRKLWQTTGKQILERSIINSRRARKIRNTPLRNEQDHSLSCARQNHAIRILQVEPPALIPQGLPLGALEGATNPFILTVVKVTIPANANPIEFQSLHRKLGRYIFKIVGGPDIGFVVEKPIGRNNFSLDPNALCLQSQRLRGRDQAVPLCSPRFLPKPLSRYFEVASDIDGIVSLDLAKRGTSLLRLIIDELPNECRKCLSSKRAHRHSQMQMFVLLNPWRSEESRHLNSRPILRKRHPRRDVDLPLRKLCLKRADPFRDTGLSSVDLLPATHQAYHRAPVRMTVHHIE